MAIKNAKKTRVSQPLKLKNSGKSLKALRLKKQTVYVAVIARVSGGLDSFRDDGAWSSIMGTNKDTVISDALALVRKYGADRYEVHVGTLTEKVVIPTIFKVVKL